MRLASCEDERARRRRPPDPRRGFGAGARAHLRCTRRPTTAGTAPTARFWKSEDACVAPPRAPDRARRTERVRPARGHRSHRCRGRNRAARRPLRVRDRRRAGAGRRRCRATLAAAGLSPGPTLTFCRRSARLIPEGERLRQGVESFLRPECPAPDMGSLGPMRFRPGARLNTGQVRDRRGGARRRRRRRRRHDPDRDRAGRARRRPSRRHELAPARLLRRAGHRPLADLPDRQRRQPARGLPDRRRRQLRPGRTGASSSTATARRRPIFFTGQVSTGCGAATLRRRPVLLPGRPEHLHRPRLLRRAAQPVRRAAAARSPRPT